MIAVAVAVAIALAAVGILGVVRLVDLDRATPRAAILVCGAALALRAALSVLIVLSAIVVVPSTAMFDAVTHWCLHTISPLARQHLPLNGHLVGDLSLLVPAAAVLVSVAWVALGLWRGVRRVDALVRRHGAGRGPENSLIIADESIMLAAVGVRRPRVLVSSGALIQMDDDELSAGFAHEHGHIAHRHGLLIPIAHGLAAVGRLIPGTSTLRDELEFHSERQADEFALRRHAPLSLASAICKAAIGARGVPAPALALGRGSLERRLEILLSRRTSPRHDRVAALLAGCLVTLTVAIGATGVATASAGVHDASPRPALKHCA